MVGRIIPWFHRLARGSLKVAIVGNCQARPLGLYMQMIEPRIQLTKPVIVHLVKPEEEEVIHEQLEKADIIFAQLVGDNYKPGFVATSRLKAIHGEKVVPWINLYFQGYNPELQYWRDFSGDESQNPLIAYHITTIIDGAREGLRAQEILKHLQDPDWNAQRYRGVADTSLGKLDGREADLPVKIVDIIRAQWLHTHLFFTFNHPSAQLLFNYAERLLVHCGEMRKGRSSSPLPELLDTLQIPVNPLLPGFTQNTDRTYIVPAPESTGSSKRLRIKESDLVDLYLKHYTEHL